MQKTKKKNYITVVLVVLLLVLAVGYAAGQTVLTVNGTAKGNYKWDVKFTAASFKDENGDAVSADKATATVTNDTTITADVKNLTYPGDGVVLEATITNSGTVPAKLSEFVIDPETDADLEVTVADGFATDEVIPVGGTCTVQFLVKWKAGSTANTLDKTFTITFTYDQDTVEFDPELTHTDA